MCPQRPSTGLADTFFNTRNRRAPQFRNKKRKKLDSNFLRSMSGLLDSNQRPHAPQTRALPTALNPVACIAFSFAGAKVHTICERSKFFGVLFCILTFPTGARLTRRTPSAPPPSGHCGERPRGRLAMGHAPHTRHRPAQKAAQRHSHTRQRGTGKWRKNVCGKQNPAYPDRESNSDLLFRRELFYPLNYQGNLFTACKVTANSPKYKKNRCLFLRFGLFAVTLWSQEHH